MESTHCASPGVGAVARQSVGSQGATASLARIHARCPVCAAGYDAERASSQKQGLRQTTSPDLPKCDGCRVTATRVPLAAAVEAPIHRSRAALNREIGGDVASGHDVGRALVEVRKPV